MRSLLSVNDRYSESTVSVLDGATRVVILVGRWAVKFPQVRYGWRNFLFGLLANMQERTFARAGWPELCPVVCSLPGGWLVVMPRCDPVSGLTDARYAEMTDIPGCCEHTDDVHFPGGGCALCPIDAYNHDYDTGYVVPAENKDDSFGWLGGDAGRLVAVDYGGFGR